MAKFRREDHAHNHGKPTVPSATPAARDPRQEQAEADQSPPCPICGNGEQHGHGEPRTMSSDGLRIVMQCVCCGHSWLHARRPVDDYRRCKACWPKRGGVYVATSTQVRADGARRRYYRCTKCGYTDSVEIATESVTITKTVVRAEGGSG